MFVREIGPEMGDSCRLSAFTDYTWRIIYFGGAEKCA